MIKNCKVEYVFITKYIFKPFRTKVVPCTTLHPLFKANTLGTGALNGIIPLAKFTKVCIIQSHLLKGGISGISQGKPKTQVKLLPVFAGNLHFLGESVIRSAAVYYPLST